MTLDSILEEIKKAQTIVVLTHESPDGDAVSSSLSVMHAISQLGKEVDVIIPEFSRDFKFLPGIEKILQKSEIENAESVSKDLQAISSTIVVNYKISNKSSATIYRSIGRDYETIMLMPAIHESLKAVTAKYTAEELVTSRSKVAVEIQETLEEKMADYGILIEKFNIVNFSFSEEFSKAIEAKEVAQQNLLKAKTEQEQAIVEAKAQAEQLIAEGEAEYMKILSKAYNDPSKADFYEFVRSLDAAKESLASENGENVLILDKNSPLVDIF